MKKYVITVNGNSYEVEVEEVKGGAANAASRPATPAPSAPARATSVADAQPKTAPAPKAAPAPVAVGGSVTAPMPGTIFKVQTRAGDAVKKGDVLIILEAMKMENEIFAPTDGTVASVNVNEGASVNAGDVLVTFE